jgi:D-alanyl-D-alanine carboxypeptidase
MYNQKVFENIDVKAKAYIVYDLVDKKIISSKNENDVLPLASIAKMMTAITALSHNATTTRITINSSSTSKRYDLGLKKNQSWDLDELLKYTLIFSSNDGAQAIADGLGGSEPFISQMNIDAKLLGFNTFHFTHPAGLDINDKLGGVGSALEVAKLFEVALKRFPEILDATTKTRATVTASNGKIIGIPNTNQNIAQFFGVEASKTGFTDMAGGNLAVIVDITVGHPVVIVVLGSTYDERFTDVEILYKTLEKSLEK